MRSPGLWLTLLALGLAGLTGLVLWQSVQLDSLSAIQQRLESWRGPGSVWRCSVLALVAFAGSGFLYLRDRTRCIDAQVLRCHQLRHWRVIAWLAMIEVLLAQQVLHHVLASLSGAGP